MGNLKATGNITFSLGMQKINTDSIFPAEGGASHPSIVSRKTNIVLKLSESDVFSSVFDAQYDRRPYSENVGRVNQLYAAFNVTSSLKVRVGKQRVLWGHGFIYVPTDFINPPLDPSGLDPAKIGVPSVTFDFISDSYSITGLLQRERNSVDSAGVKYSPNGFSGIDLDFIYFHAPSIGNALGVSGALDAEQIISPRLNGFVLSGGIAAHQKSRYPEVISAQFINANGVVDYPALGESGKRGSYYSYLAGVTYQASSNLILMGEYYHIGDAYSNADYKTLLTSLTNKGTLRQSLASPWLDHLAYGRNQRNYLNISINQGGLTEGNSRLTDTFGVELSMLRNLDDQSGVTSVALISDYWGETTITLRNFFPYGQKTTEFGTAPYTWYSQLSIKIGF